MFAGVSSALIYEELNDGRSRQPSGISELKHSIFPLVLAHIGKKPLKLLGDQTPIRLAQRNHHDAKMGGIDIRKSVEEITVRREDHSTRFNRFFPNYGITRAEQPYNPQINHLVPLFLKKSGHTSWKILIQQKLHATAS